MSKVERGSAAGQLSCGGQGGHMCASVQWQLKLCASVQPGANVSVCQYVPVFGASVQLRAGRQGQQTCCVDPPSIYWQSVWR